MVGVARTSGRRKRRGDKSDDIPDGLAKKWAKRFLAATLIGGGAILGDRYVTGRRNRTFVRPTMTGSVRSVSEPWGGGAQETARDRARNFARSMRDRFTETSTSYPIGTVDRAQDPSPRAPFAPSGWPEPTWTNGANID